jgi:D-alanine-D-alanine ligase
MIIALLHNEVHPQEATADDRDVLQQVAAVGTALQSLGHQTSTLPCSLDLLSVQRHLRTHRPDCVFNLVESLGGTDRLLHVVPALLESLAIPCTGSPALALHLSTDKLAAKQRMRDCGLPTPAWFVELVEGSEPWTAGPYIVKAVYEHASFGLDEAAVAHFDSPDQLADSLAETAERMSRPCFAEAYIDGREFNLSLLASAQGPLVLPPAEIVFQNWAPDQPRIVGYRAKWQEDSAEYTGTPRTFQFSAADRSLLNELRVLAVACWEIFQLRGYARVDFRVDKIGRPWILEVNANPCLSPDAGFAAALAEAGIDFTEAVARIVADANGESRIQSTGSGRWSGQSGRKGG